MCHSRFKWGIWARTRSTRQAFNAKDITGESMSLSHLFPPLRIRKSSYEAVTSNESNMPSGMNIHLHHARFISDVPVRPSPHDTLLDHALWVSGKPGIPSDGYLFAIAGQIYVDHISHSCAT